MIAEKTKIALANGLKVILCIGELLEDRESGKTMDVCKAQLQAVVNAVEEKDWENIVIAYIIREGEDYLFSFNTVNVTITPENDRLFWYLIIFGVVILIIIAGTLMLYQEIRKKERELTIGSVREKMKDF